jgi:hypothetical protein
MRTTEYLTMTASPRAESDSTTPVAAVAVAWLLVSVPLLWGIWETIKKAAALFS